MSLFFKSIAVRRIYDKTTDTLIYVAYSRQVQDASAKMGLSTVALSSTDSPGSSAAVSEYRPSSDRRLQRGLARHQRRALSRQT